MGDKFIRSCENCVRRFRYTDAEAEECEQFSNAGSDVEMANIAEHCTLWVFDVSCFSDEM